MSSVELGISIVTIVRVQMKSAVTKDSVARHYVLILKWVEYDNVSALFRCRIHCAVPTGLLH